MNSYKRNSVITISVKRRQATCAYSFVQLRIKAIDGDVSMWSPFQSVENVTHGKKCRTFKWKPGHNGQIYLHQFQMGERDQEHERRGTPQLPIIPLVRRVAIFLTPPSPTYITILSTTTEFPIFSEKTLLRFLFESGERFCQLQFLGKGIPFLGNSEPYDPVIP